MLSPRPITWDRIGAWTGGACAVHCLVLSVAAATLPMLGLGGIHSPFIDWGFLAIAATVGPLAVLTGYRKHHTLWPSLLYTAGIVVIIISHLAFHEHTIRSISAEALLSALGGVLLLSFHLFNARLSHQSGCGCGTCKS